MASTFANKDLYQQVADEAIRYYPYDGAEAKLLAFSENATYVLRDPQSHEPYGVLRIGRPGYHTIEEYEGEMSWLRQINDYTPLIVANPLTGRDGKYIQVVPGPDGRNYSCVVTEFLKGETLENGDDSYSTDEYEQLGEITAYLHRQSYIWNGTKNIVRTHWDYDTMIGDHPIWGRWQAFGGFNEEQRDELTRCCKIIRRRLERYGKTPENFGLIHADLRGSNVMVDESQIKVIDFDDCGFGWHLHDLAGSISFIEDRDFVPDLINAWHDGYCKVMPFTDTDFVEIDTFILQRRLQLTAWLASHSDSDPVKDLSRGWVEGTMYLADRYLHVFG